MFESLKRIIPAVLAGLLAVSAPPAAHAQLDAAALLRAQQRGENTNLYGTNPFETQDEEGELQDTTKKERRIRKPLESYFFNDSIRALPNFVYHVDREYNRVKIGPIDTALTDFRIDYPFYEKGVGDAPIGGLGQASIPLDYFERPASFDFGFADPYHVYLYRMENVPFYNLKKPMIRFTYLESGQKRYREENFHVMVAQNISPSTGFNVNYKIGRAHV